MCEAVGIGGRLGGMTADSSVLRWKSSERTVDVAVFFGGLGAPGEDGAWADGVAEAVSFVDAMRDEGAGAFWTRTGVHSVSVNHSSVPEDPHTGAYPGDRRRPPHRLPGPGAAASGRRGRRVHGGVGERRGHVHGVVRGNRAPRDGVTRSATNGSAHDTAEADVDGPLSNGFIGVPGLPAAAWAPPPSPLFHSRPARHTQDRTLRGIP